MNTINTPNGPKTPIEALVLFKQAMLSQGALLGIYNALCEHAPDEAREAAKFIIENPTRFNGKLLKKAQDNSTNIGLKRITNRQETHGLLASYGARPTVRIIFRADRPRKVTQVTALHPHLLEFHDANAEMFLVECVRVSGEWQGIARTYFVTLKAAEYDEYEQLAQAFVDTIESIELVNTLKARIAAWDCDEETLAHPGFMELLGSGARSDVFYDESVFRNACRAIGFTPEVENRVVENVTNPNHPLPNILYRTVPGNITRFAQEYIKAFDTAMA